MASAACRTRIASPDRHPRDLAPVPVSHVPNRQPSALVSPDLKVSAGAIARDLEALCAMGFIEKFKDEHNITRYRPTGGRVA